MYFDDAEGTCYSPPSEDKGLILRVSIGCSHNACTFCGMYRGISFRKRDLAEIEGQIRKAADCYPNLRSVFLGDGNAMVLPTEDLAVIIGMLKKRFPLLTSIACAATAKDVLRKSRDDLDKLRISGMTLIYLGVESGDDVTLRAINKGACAAEMIAAGQRVCEAGMQLSAMVIVGLAGRERSFEHTKKTADVINKIQPAMLSIMTLQLREGTPLKKMADVGRFISLTLPEVLVELTTLLKHINVSRPCLLRASRLYNPLPLSGTLPDEKDLLLEQMRRVEVEGELSEDCLKYKNYGIF
jgi:radical SAM superfamily enzyme YgiQ (UPF0313 family)